MLHYLLMGVCFGLAAAWLMFLGGVVKDIVTGKIDPDRKNWPETDDDGRIPGDW